MSKNLEKYKGTYEYKSLTEKHTFDQVGVWQIYGEDPNCDFGGHHHKPFLGNVEGKLIDVVEYAVELPRFWQWGAGGTIEKMAEIVKVNAVDNKKREELKIKEQELLEQLEEIRKQIEG